MIHCSSLYTAVTYTHTYKYHYTLIYIQIQLVVAHGWTNVLPYHTQRLSPTTATATNPPIINKLKHLNFKVVFRSLFSSATSPSPSTSYESIQQLAIDDIKRHIYNRNSREKQEKGGHNYDPLHRSEPISGVGHGSEAAVALVNTIKAQRDNSILSKLTQYTSYIPCINKFFTILQGQIYDLHTIPILFLGHAITQSSIYIVESITNIIQNSIQYDTNGYIVSYIPILLTSLLSIHIAVEEYILLINKYYNLLPYTKVYNSKILYTIHNSKDAIHNGICDDILQLRKVIILGLDMILRCYSDHLRLFTFCDAHQAIIKAKLSGK